MLFIIMFIIKQKLTHISFAGNYISLLARGKFCEIYASCGVCLKVN